MLAYERDHSVQRDLQEEQHRMDKEVLCSTHEEREKRLQDELEQQKKLIAEKDAKISSVCDERINDLHEHNRQIATELQNGRQAQAFLCNGLMEATRAMATLSMQMTQLLSPAQIKPQPQPVLEIEEEMEWIKPLTAHSSEVNLAVLAHRE